MYVPDSSLCPFFAYPLARLGKSRRSYAHNSTQDGTRLGLVTPCLLSQPIALNLGIIAVIAGIFLIFSPPADAGLRCPSPPRPLADRCKRNANAPQYLRRKIRVSPSGKWSRTVLRSCANEHAKQETMSASRQSRRIHRRDLPLLLCDDWIFYFGSRPRGNGNGARVRTGAIALLRGDAPEGDEEAAAKRGLTGRNGRGLVLVLLDQAFPQERKESRPPSHEV